MKILLKRRCLFLFLLLLLAKFTNAQNIIVNTATLEGLDITPDNMWGFQIQSMESKDIRSRVEGHIRFRNTSHSIKFSFMYTIKPGLNVFDANTVHPTWSFSSAALRELFIDYKVLPQGTYQYCIAVTPNVVNSESVGGDKVDDCIYKQSKDLFSITLLEPEDDAKLYEYNPMLTWVATYPFLSELTYRVRVAEIKEGQNTENAITRNNPVYSEKNLIPSTVIYPVYAKPLQAWQPYAWTVDAYYKGILLGGAQPWKFTIVEDSLLKEVPKDPPYIELNAEKGLSVFYAAGELKLKYIERNRRYNKLQFTIIDEKQKPVKYKDNEWLVKNGDNRTILVFHETINLKHWALYKLVVKTEDGNEYAIPFRYVNPLYLK